MTINRSDGLTHILSFSKGTWIGLQGADARGETPVVQLKRGGRRGGGGWSREEADERAGGRDAARSLRGVGRRGRRRRRQQRDQSRAGLVTSCWGGGSAGWRPVPADRHGSSRAPGRACFAVRQHVASVRPAQGSSRRRCRGRAGRYRGPRGGGAPRGPFASGEGRHRVCTVRVRLHSPPGRTTWGLSSDLRHPRAARIPRRLLLYGGCGQPRLAVGRRSVPLCPRGTRQRLGFPLSACTPPGSLKSGRRPSTGETTRHMCVQRPWRTCRARTWMPINWRCPHGGQPGDGPPRCSQWRSRRCASRSAARRRPQRRLTLRAVSSCLWGPGAPVLHDAEQRLGPALLRERRLVCHRWPRLLVLLRLGSRRCSHPVGAARGERAVRQVAIDTFNTAIAQHQLPNGGFDDGTVRRTASGRGSSRSTSA